LASSDSASGIRLGASGQPYHAPRANCFRSAYHLRLLDLVEWEATKGVEHGRRTWSLRASRDQRLWLKSVEGTRPRSGRA